MKINRDKITHRIYNLLPDRERDYGESQDDINDEKEKLADTIYDFIIETLITDNPEIKITIL